MKSRIIITNWDRFQHYKNRNPPWIKMHRALLDNREWHALSGDASKLLAECWLLASEYDEGAIPMNARDLAWRLRRPDAARVAECLQELSAAGFVQLVEQNASAVLAERKQDAIPEAEAEGELEEDANASLSGSGKPNADPARRGRDELTARRIRQVFEHWQTTCGHTRATLTKERRAKIRARLKTFSVEDLCRAVDAAAADPFYQGDNDRHTRYDFPETIFKSDAATERLMLSRHATSQTAVVVND